MSDGSTSRTAGHIYFAFAYLSPYPRSANIDRFGFAARVPLLSPGLSARAPEDQRGD